MSSGAHSPRAQLLSLRIENLRCIDKLEVPLDGLKVLIGENGTGKSTIFEALEILRHAARPDLATMLAQVHGGAYRLMRRRTISTDIRLGLTFQSDGPQIAYDCWLGWDGRFLQISHEEIDATYPPGGDRPPEAVQGRVQVQQRAGMLRVTFPGTKEVRNLKAGGLSLLGATLSATPENAGITSNIRRVRDALDGLEVHVPFDVSAPWIEPGRSIEGARGLVTAVRATTLARRGTNNTNVYHALKNDFGSAHWSSTLDLLRLGLSYDLDDVVVQTYERGQVSLALRRRGQEDPISAAALSDGELAFLIFVGLFRLPAPGRTLLGFDEPELHLHPGLVQRIVGLFEAEALSSSALIATHSDRLLDYLENPAESVLVCDLDPVTRTTCLRQVDATELSSWLERYSGLGSLRSAGYLPHVTRDPAVRDRPEE